MQTGRQVANVTGDEIANFYFGEDGIVKTGKQTIYNEETGETENWFFHTDGDEKKDRATMVFGTESSMSTERDRMPLQTRDTLLPT